MAKRVPKAQIPKTPVSKLFGFLLLLQDRGVSTHAVVTGDDQAMAAVVDLDGPNAKDASKILKQEMSGKDTTWWKVGNKEES